MQKTIFITIYDGDTEKNVLRSGVLRKLVESGNRIIILIRDRKRTEYYKLQFEGGNVIVDSLPPALTWGEDLWYHVSWNSVPTYAAYIRRRMRFESHRNYVRYSFETLLWHLAHFRGWRSFLRWMYAAVPDTYAYDLFEKYSPDVVFTPNMFSPEDFRMLRAAKRRGIPTIATAKSWDVLTTKAFTRVRADKLLVFNEHNRLEAITIGDYAESDVIVTGFPQFDVYINPVNETKDSFCEQLGIPRGKRIILFGVPGDWMAPHVNEIIAELNARIERGELPRDTHILARLHPKYPDSGENSQLTHVTYERPGTHLSSGRETSIDMGIVGTYKWTFTDADIMHLQASIFFSEVVLNVASTLVLDAAANNRPAIFIGYDGNQSPSYWKSVARYYERDHIRHVVEAGVPIVRSHDELVHFLNRCLGGMPGLGVKMETVRERLLFKPDGKAAERIAEAVLTMI